MKDKREFALCVGLSTVLILFIDILYVQRLTQTYEMNGIVYKEVGLMQYQAPDGNTLFIPIFKKGDK